MKRPLECTLSFAKFVSKTQSFTTRLWYSKNQETVLIVAFCHIPPPSLLHFNVFIFGVLFDLLALAGNQVKLEIISVSGELCRKATNAQRTVEKSR